MRKIITIGLTTLSFAISMITTLSRVDIVADETDYKIEIESQETMVPETTTEIITTIEQTIEIVTESSTQEETLKRKSKKKKKSNKSNETEAVPVQNEPEGNQYNYQRNNYVQEPTQRQVKNRQEILTTQKKQIKKKTEKQTPKPTEKQTKKVVNNTVPSQSQDTRALGASNISLIKNTIMSGSSGSYNANMQNLAIYMAKTGSSNAQSTLNSLCQNTTLKVTGKRATATAASSSSSDVLVAAEKLAGSLRGNSKYGIGISVSYSGGKFKITAVVAIQTN